MKPRTTLALTPQEDRTVPTVLTISVSSNTLVEASGPPAPVTVTVTRDNTSGSLGYNFSRTGTGTAGSDYSAPPGTGLFANGQATSTFFVWALDDSTSEATETAILTLTAGSGYTVGTPDSVTLNILDNDAQVVTVAKVFDATEGGGDGKLRLTRIGDLSGTLTASYTVSGTATSGTDFTSIGTSVTFAANSATADVTVVATDDTGTYDPGETVVLTVGTGSGYSVGSPSAATVTIYDNAENTFTLNSTTGAIWYNTPWDSVDPTAATQSLALSNFNLAFAGYNFTPASSNFTTSPTAQFEYGEFVGITFAIDTSALSGFGYSSISATGLTVSAVIPGTATTVSADIANQATVVLDFSKMSFPTAEQGAVTWQLYTLTGTNTEARSTNITIPSNGTPAAVRVAVESALKDMGIAVKGEGTTLEIKGTTDNPLKIMKIIYTSATDMTPPAAVTITGTGQNSAPEFAWSRKTP